MTTRQQLNHLLRLIGNAQAFAEDIVRNSEAVGDEGTIAHTADLLGGSL